MMLRRLIILGGILLIGLQGCSLFKPAAEVKSVGQVKLLATGYGAPPKKYYPENQRKLMAMRAAKLDAYRTLAERVQGLRVLGDSTVGELVLTEEGFKTELDAFVMGARVLSIDPTEDGNYQAVIEAVIEEDFLARARHLHEKRLTIAANAAEAAAKATKKPDQATSDSKPIAVVNPPNFYYSEGR